MTRGGDFLSAADLSPVDLIRVLGLAAEIKANPASVAGELAGSTVGLFFQKPSTRTRVSCEVACVHLGAHPVVLKNEEVGLGTREAVEDVARVLDRYLDVLAFRVFHHRDLEAVAANAAAPVINLLSDREHPCQALADLQTVAEHRPLAGTVLTYVGDGNNVCHSLMLAGAMAGMEIRAVTPVGFEPDPSVGEQAQALAAEHGGRIVVSTDLDAAVPGSDVVYTDVWASMGQEHEADDRKGPFEGYRVTLDMFESAGDDAIFLHCLPAHRGEEVTHEVLEHPRSFVFDQAENRAHAFGALLLHLAG